MCSFTLCPPNQKVFPTPLNNAIPKGQYNKNTIPSFSGYLGVAKKVPWERGYSYTHTLPPVVVSENMHRLNCIV